MTCGGPLAPWQLAVRRLRCSILCAELDAAHTRLVNAYRLADGDRDHPAVLHHQRRYRELSTALDRRDRIG